MSPPPATLAIGIFRTVVSPHKPSSESDEATVAQTAVFAVCGFHSGLTDKPRTSNADYSKKSSKRRSASKAEVRATLLADIFREDYPRPFGGLVSSGGGALPVSSLHHSVSV